jgi:succinyl-CoA synthetase beta subunit
VVLFVVTAEGGVVDAYKNMGDAINVPIIVRLQGTNAAIAKELIIQECQFYLQLKQLIK